jgi:hypothetical protein
MCDLQVVMKVSQSSEFGIGSPYTLAVLGSGILSFMSLVEKNPLKLVKLDIVRLELTL